MMKRDDMNKAYYRTKKVIQSCETLEQVDVARNMVQAFVDRFFKWGDSILYFATLQSQLRIKFRTLTHGISEETE